MSRRFTFPVVLLHLRFETMLVVSVCKDPEYPLYLDLPLRSYPRLMCRLFRVPVLPLFPCGFGLAP